MALVQWAEERDSMALQGVHLLLTYRCDRECDHCFVWGGPSAQGTMTVEFIRRLLADARRLGTVQRIYFEGGEPFLYYPLLLAGMRLAYAEGFECGIVTNGYWAVGVEEAIAALRPLIDLGLVDLSVSTDRFHGEEDESPEWQRIREAASWLGIPADTISLAPPRAPVCEGNLRLRGRAAERLVAGLPLVPWEELSTCPHEQLAEPERVHVDAFGHVHLCQGLLLGNVREQPFDTLVETYRPEAHPIVGPLLEGGPAALVRRYDLPHAQGYVEECHLCYRAREMLRERFPEYLGPQQVYGGSPTIAGGQSETPSSTVCSRPPSEV